MLYATAEKQHRPSVSVRAPTRPLARARSDPAAEHPGFSGHSGQTTATRMCQEAGARQGISARRRRGRTGCAATPRRRGVQLGRARDYVESRGASALVLSIGAGANARRYPPGHGRHLPRVARRTPGAVVRRAHPRERATAWTGSDAFAPSIAADTAGEQDLLERLLRRVRMLGEISSTSCITVVSIWRSTSLGAGSCSPTTARVVFRWKAIVNLLGDAGANPR
jgi:hypothetical protein